MINTYNRNWENNMQEVEECPCMENMERIEMMEKIQALNFGIIELALYLNTHPEDERALCMHREYAKKLKEVSDKYQRIYGPLSIYYPCNKWRWLEEPWTWEGGNF